MLEPVWNQGQGRHPPPSPAFRALQAACIPRAVLTLRLSLQVDAGNILYIENKGIESYADPKNPPQRTGRVSSRAPTATSRAADLVGKVVRAVQELGSEGSSLKVIAAHLQAQGALNDPDGANLVRHATKRALQRGFLAQNGKLYTLGTLTKHRKSTGRPPVAKALHLDDDDDDDIGLALHDRTLEANAHLQVSTQAASPSPFPLPQRPQRAQDARLSLAALRRPVA